MTVKFTIKNPETGEVRSHVSNVAGSINAELVAYQSAGLEVLHYRILD